jgi:hypothetical protein
MKVKSAELFAAVILEIERRVETLLENHKRPYIDKVMQILQEEESLTDKRSLITLTSLIQPLAFHDLKMEQEKIAAFAAKNKSNQPTLVADDSQGCVDENGRKREVDGSGARGD